MFVMGSLRVLFIDLSSKLQFHASSSFSFKEVVFCFSCDTDIFSENNFDKHEGVCAFYFSFEIVVFSFFVLFI